MFPFLSQRGVIFEKSITFSFKTLFALHSHNYKKLCEQLHY